MSMVRWDNVKRLRAKVVEFERDESKARDHAKQARTAYETAAQALAQANVDLQKALFPL